MIKIIIIMIIKWLENMNLIKVNNIIVWIVKENNYYLDYIIIVKVKM
jgi:hypothetical protein